MLLLSTYHITRIEYISDVLLVPELDQNLLSVGQMIEKGYSLLFKEGSCVGTDVNGCNALFIYLIILLENIVYYYILYDFW